MRSVWEVFARGVREEDAFWDRYARYWLEPVPNLFAAWQRPFAAKATKLAERNVRLLIADDAPEADRALVSRWRAALETCAQGYRTCGDTPPASGEDLAFHFIHLMNNRLGLMPLEEAYLATLLTEAGLGDAIRGPGPLTLFAPTDEAFEELSADTNARLRSDPELLSHLLGHHLAEGLFVAADLPSVPVTVFDEHVLAVQVDGEHVLVEGVPIVESDLQTGNGVVHVVPHLLMPRELDLTATTAR